MAEPGRSLWAALHLLDRQVVDRDGIPVAKVDDLEIAPSHDPAGLPMVTDILCGQAALAHRFSPRLGRGIERLRRVIDPTPDPGPARISFADVVDMGPQITLGRTRDDLEVLVIERWLAREILAHIPGSGAGPAPEDTP